jgi:cell division protein DivIC
LNSTLLTTQVYGLFLSKIFFLPLLLMSEEVKNKWVSLKNRFRIFRNKYIFTLTIFSFFALFLDEYDLFTLISQNRKLSKIQDDQQAVELKLKETKKTLNELKYSAALERYAREQKLFKKDDEDVFIISYE